MCRLHKIWWHGSITTSKPYKNSPHFDNTILNAFSWRKFVGFHSNGTGSHWPDWVYRSTWWFHMPWCHLSPCHQHTQFWLDYTSVHHWTLYTVIPIEYPQGFVVPLFCYKNWKSLWDSSDAFIHIHGWPSTQPGTCTQPCPIVHTAVPPLFTQPCPGRTMSTAVCIYVAGLCASCPAV